jgi:hypothetical protein
VCTVWKSSKEIDFAISETTLGVPPPAVLTDPPGRALAFSGELKEAWDLEESAGFGSSRVSAAIVVQFEPDGGGEAEHAVGLSRVPLCRVPTLSRHSVPITRSVNILYNCYPRGQSNKQF